MIDKNRKYADKDWACKRTLTYVVCRGEKICMEWYPNLICERGHRVSTE